MATATPISSTTGIAQLRAMCKDGISLNECDLAAAVPGLLDRLEHLEDAVRALFGDWIYALVEHTDSRIGVGPLVEQAKARAAGLGVNWEDSFLPGWVLGALEFSSAQQLAADSFEQELESFKADSLAGLIHYSWACKWFTKNSSGSWRLRWLTFNPQNADRPLREGKSTLSPEALVKCFSGEPGSLEWECNNSGVSLLSGGRLTWTTVRLSDKFVDGSGEPLRNWTLRPGEGEF